MRLNVKKNTVPRQKARQKKKLRIRKTVRGTEERPRLCVYRSGKHMYAQIINDVTGTTLAATSSLAAEAKGTGKAVATAVGRENAKAARA